MCRSWCFLLFHYWISCYALTQQPNHPHSTTQHSNKNRLFLETADTEIWKDVLPIGIFHGVSTNPMLLEQSQQACSVSNLHSLARTALTTPGCHEFICSAWGATTDEMYDIGMQLSQPNRKQIVITVPVTVRGVEAAAHLLQSGVRVGLTACVDPKQAIVAAGLNVEYLIPSFQNLIEYNTQQSQAQSQAQASQQPQQQPQASQKQNSGPVAAQQTCQEIQDILIGMNSPTRLLISDITNIQDIQQLVSTQKLNTFSFPPQVARSMFQVPYTDQIASQYETAAKYDPTTNYRTY